MVTIPTGIFLRTYDNKNNFPNNAQIGDYFIVTETGLETDPIKRVYHYVGEWKLSYSNTEVLRGKKAYFAGDSITNNVNAPTNWCDFVSWHFGMERVKKIGSTTTNYANSGTTAINGIPLNPIASPAGAPNLVQITELTPNYSPVTDGVFFIAYLTNDVGLNLPNYTVEKYGQDLEQAIANLLNKGWPIERIKIVGRYYCPLAGLNYTNVAGSGVTVPATQERYNIFGAKAVEVATLYGAQSFDLYNTMAYIAGIDSYFDSFKRHFNSYAHSFVSADIIKEMYI